VRIPLSEPAAKRMTLRELVGRANVKNGIVFCNRKSEVDVVAKSLKTHGFDAAPIHGDLDQTTRTRTLESFRKGELRLLVASDVAARGLDIPDVSHVFNYDVPHHADDYVHRIGRTGRAGKSGETFMIVTPADSRNLDKVIKLIGQAPEDLKMDLDWDEARARGERQRKNAPDRSAKGGRGRGRERDHDRPVRSNSDRPRRAEAETAPLATVESAEPAAATPRQPRRERAPRAEVQPAAPQTERPQREPRPPREARSDRSERPSRDAKPSAQDRPERDDNGVRGFGSDTPAFLMRAPAPGPSTKK